MMKAENLGWKQNMDRLALEKEADQDKLLSAESQLQGTLGFYFLIFCVGP